METIFSDKWMGPFGGVLGMLLPGLSGLSGVGNHWYYRRGSRTPSTDVAQSGSTGGKAYYLVLRWRNIRLRTECVI